MKIYTKTGDKGQTSLYGGTKVSKSDLRIEAYGSVDELNSWLGLLVQFSSLQDLRAELQEMQHVLFDIGAILASDSEERASKLPQVGLEAIQTLEQTIDKISATLPVLKHFVLPGGSPEAAQVQITRTICRRAERAVVRLDEQERVSSEIIIYLNRLSDLLFVMGRQVCVVSGSQEIIWQSRHKKEF